MADAPVQLQRYTRTAIVLHWVIAMLIVWQIGSGVWMVPAIDDPGQFMRAFSVYQVHKSTGLLVLMLSLVRLAWRLRHPPPSMPATIPAWQQMASRVVHAGLYALMIAVPLAGWLVVSASPFGLPTMVFGLFEWPHVPVSTGVEATAKIVHRGLGYALGVLALGHMAAALVHHYVARDRVLSRMKIGTPNI